MIKELPMNELRDINIDINDPKTVMLDVIKQTQDKQDVTVLLYNGHYTHNEVVNLINSTWKAEYAHHLEDNNIKLEIINPKRSYEVEEAKKVRAV